MDPSEIDVLPAELGAGTARVFARRHVLAYRHPAVAAAGDFLASLAGAFGPPSAASPGGYILWHRPTGTHLTAYVHEGWGAYGGGVRFERRPDLAAVREAYAAESRRTDGLPPGPDPLLADLTGSASSFAEHVREVDRARAAAPRGFYDRLVDFEAMLSRFPPPDRREVLVAGLEGPGPVTLLARGVEAGKYFERQVDLEQAHRTLSEKLHEDPRRLPTTLFDWWAQRARAPKPPEALGPVLLAAWRDRFDAAMAEAPPDPADAAYQADARARHADHERAQRWMRFARLGLLLPLAPADADRLAARASGVATQSTEHKKLQRLRGRPREG